MFTDHFFVFFDGPGKESLADEFKGFVEPLLGEEAGVGRAMMRFELPDPTLPGHDPADFYDAYESAPVTISFPGRAFPGESFAQRRASRQKAKSLVTWLRRRQRRRTAVRVEIGAGYFAPVLYTPKELTAAIVLELARQLQTGGGGQPPGYVLDDEPDPAWDETAVVSWKVEKHWKWAGW